MCIDLPSVCTVCESASGIYSFVQLLFSRLPRSAQFSNATGGFPNAECSSRFRHDINWNIYNKKTFEHDVVDPGTWNNMYYNFNRIALWNVCEFANFSFIWRMAGCAWNVLAILANQRNWENKCAFTNNYVVNTMSVRIERTMTEKQFIFVGHFLASSEFSGHQRAADHQSFFLCSTSSHTNLYTYYKHIDLCVYWKVYRLNFHAYIVHHKRTDIHTDATLAPAYT